ncbi:MULTISPECIES: 1-acyl-sn-glycerol-3-phosphate acyltransferase [unclassified Beijerinckia]|uniref:lysophospholipid acyltransferase family protein n=1 Tax=unclassified Beijerinckia TaxID=2638183 RepID=UPI000895CBF5|nr:MULTISPECIES: 1-acyl-sn-glycerol-3-phosphate acyltransferase [unclassified Beijerinckia]MDH7798046.1 1-acyl-sn-glycerol-3-phosphate acyltransferase [Beijerinckia sp. GAS462]SED07070.1 1-acyl-sn-glycerol-3-phosphate acyltransferase [Beijerinckia sp. 28-YEA-48]
MLYIRSALFNVLFYLNLIIIMILGLPLLATNRYSVFWLCKIWGKSSLWLLDKICGTKAEFRGLENIPKGALIIAPKHQSIWETFALEMFFDDYSIILKRQLMWLPLFGWYLKRADLIAIDRASGRSALEQIIQQAKKLPPQGRQLLCFPEGTRRPPGAPPRYRIGIAQIYMETGMPCLPVAMNSGLFWARRSFLRRPGTIVVEFLPVIPPGLPREEFFTRLQTVIEDASNRLMTEAIAKDPSLAQLMVKEG